MKNSILIIVLVFLSIFFTSCEKEPVTSFQIATDNPLKSHIDSLVHNSFKDYATKSETVGFSIAIVDGDKIYYYNYGETKKGNNILADKNTLYEIGSITKTFTAATLLNWLNQNSINVNAAIKAYLPPSLSSNLSLNGVDITFKHLLNHTSGLPRTPSDLPTNFVPFIDYDSTKLYNYISSHPLLRTPGTPPTSEQEAEVFYGNMAYGLAGIILERQTKQTLQSIFQNTIFQASQMTLTTLNTIENITNRSYPHNISGPVTYSFLSGFNGSGALRSNLIDLVKYVQAQINASTINSLGKAMLQSQDPTIQINFKDYFAMGWEFYYTSSNKKLTSKRGETSGFTSFITFDKNSQKAIVALYNNYKDNSPGAPYLVLLDEYFK